MKDLYVSLGMAKYERPNVMHGLENRQILKNMLCVRYQSDKKGITVNEDALPVGYTYDKIMHKEDYDSLHRLSGRQHFWSMPFWMKTVKKFWNNRRRLSKMEKVLPMIPLHTEI